MDLCSTKHKCSNSACPMFAENGFHSRTQKKYKEIISDKQRYRQMTDHTKQAKTGKCQTIQANDRNKIIHVNQQNVYILPGLSNSHTRTKISSQTHMDLCSTKHICSNSACQMFADKWVVLTNTKKV